VVLHSIKKSSKEGSQRLLEPAIEQEGKVRDVEDEEKLAASENTEATNIKLSTDLSQGHL
jgi:hypothetical protein